MLASLKMWALDPESGEIDISYGLTGIGKKTRDRIEVIKKIIYDLDEGRGASYDEVLEKAHELGISRSDAEKIIEKLRTIGDVYFPRYNLIKLAY